MHVWICAPGSQLHTLPNCRTTRSKSFSDTSWKFFTEAQVTLPLKLRQYAFRRSFHRGGLFTRHTMRWAVPLPCILVRCLQEARRHLSCEYGGW